ncbi:MAG: hypothetical protein A49_21890 [Methyloceanibacter sp.]|nr:MAG: hypothetical protein A49_21890 [Methyloceanibacter sp.]
MTIVAMQRITLCGLAAEKSAALDGLQALGVVHLIPLKQPGSLEPIDPVMRRRAETAFRHIATSPEKMRPYRPGKAFDLEAVVGDIIANHTELRTLSDRRDELTAQIRALEPWGDFALPSPEALAGQKMWLYALPVKDRAALDKIDQPWAIVGREPTALHVVVVSHEEPPVTLLPVLRLTTGAEPLSALKAEIEELEIAYEKAAAARTELTRWRILLGADLAAAQDLDELREVAEQTHDEDVIYALQGWAPEESMPALTALADEHGLALVIEAPGPGEQPPTLLRQGNDRFAIAGDLTNFYTSPGYRAWDPSFVVFTAFAIFFAMILADAGYAALLGLGAAFFWRKMGKTPAGRRFRTLLASLSAAAFVYGVAAGSYFGFPPPEGSFLAKLHVIDVTNFQKMMVVSVVLGAAHISIALLAAAYFSTGKGKAVAALGWVTVIAGGLLLWLGEGTARTVGGFTIAAGLAAVFLGNASDRPVNSPKDWLLRITDGMLGLTGVTKLFGDILSYLRLFALGLASASLAATFNEMALNVQTSTPGLGVLLLILILLFGHAINIVIGIMSGVVHGLRLNYIEFFGWGLTEEGYPFRAFSKRENPT